MAADKRGFLGSPDSLCDLESEFLDNERLKSGLPIQQDATTIC
jgi:hypothetical protein